MPDPIILPFTLLRGLGQSFERRPAPILVIDWTSFTDPAAFDLMHHIARGIPSFDGKGRGQVHPVPVAPSREERRRVTARLPAATCGRRIPARRGQTGRSSRRGESHHQERASERYTHTLATWLPRAQNIAPV